MQSCLILGITGRLGEEIAKIHLSQGAEVVGLSRNENAQWELEQRIPGLTLYSGDILDRDILNFIKKKHIIGKIYHCAALKHIDRAAKYPLGYTKVNVVGTDNVCRIFDNVIVVSSDKACLPSGTYGASKLLTEASALSYGHPVVRLGNLIESQGNLMRLFEIKIPKCTCRGMTRFFEHTDIVAKFITNVAGKGIHVPAMRSAKLGDIFDAFTPVAEETGNFRQDEKMHETLVAEWEDPVWQGINSFYIGDTPPHGFVRQPRGFTYQSSCNKFWTAGEIKKWKR